MKKGAGKKKEKVVVTRATREDIDEYLGERGEKMPSMVAWVGKLPSKDNKIIGMGGYYRQESRWMGFMDMEREVVRYPSELTYWSMKALQHAKKSGIRFIYAEANTKDYPNATKFLQRLGFRLDPRTLWFFRWRAY